jgi:protease I
MCKTVRLWLTSGVLAGLLLAGCARGQPQGGVSEAPSGQVQGPSAPTSPAQPQEEANLQGKKVVMVLAPRDFRDEEFEKPYEALSRAKAHVTVVSLRKGECVGVAGTKVQAVATPQAIKVQEYDALVFVGGPGMAKYLAEPQFVDLAKRFGAAHKVLGAICVAPVILANADLLKGVRATAWSSELATLRAKGAHAVDEPVVVSGRLITANGPQAAAAFGQALVAALATPSP